MVRKRLINLRRTCKQLSSRSSNSRSRKNSLIRNVSVFNWCFHYFCSSLWNINILHIWVECFQSLVALSPDSFPYFWLTSRYLKNTHRYLKKINCFKPKAEIAGIFEDRDIESKLQGLGKQRACRSHFSKKGGWSGNLLLRCLNRSLKV